MESYTKFKTTDSGIEQWTDNETGEIMYAVDPLRFTITSNEQRDAFKKKLEREHAMIKE